MAAEFPTIVHERNALSRAGKNPTAICRMPSGWAVMGDYQFLEGYVILAADPEVDHLTDLDRDARARFLLDMSLIGEAILLTTPAYRVNYEILGNTDPVLHAHVWPRFRDEPDEYRSGPVGRYPREIRRQVPFSPEPHGALKSELAATLERLINR
jgi:diadenosine tetraphosphate (Ap4A) HIT family hydrolase